MPYGLKDGNLKLMQISGGGRMRVKFDDANGRTREWWETGVSHDWKAYETDEGQRYPTEQEAEEVASNIRNRRPRP